MKPYVCVGIYLEEYPPDVYDLTFTRELQFSFTVFRNIHKITISPTMFSSLRFKSYLVTSCTHTQTHTNRAVLRLFWKSFTG